jgi:hypothetical protein
MICWRACAVSTTLAIRGLVDGAGRVLRVARAADGRSTSPQLPRPAIRNSPTASAPAIRVPLLTAAALVAHGPGDAALDDGANAHAASAPTGAPDPCGAAGFGRVPASCARTGAMSRSEGADDPTAERVVAAAGADSLETCSAIAAAISREVDRLPRSASATTASASEGSTLAATVTLRAWFTSLALLTTTGSPRRRRREPQPTQVGISSASPVATLAGMAKVSPSPNRAAICGACGWTNYPRPVPIPDRPGLLNWRPAGQCSSCGEPVSADSDRSGAVVAP